MALICKSSLTITPSNPNLFLNKFVLIEKRVAG